MITTSCSEELGTIQNLEMLRTPEGGLWKKEQVGLEDLFWSLQETAGLLDQISPQRGIISYRAGDNA